MYPHLHFAEIQMSAITLSPAEEAGDVAARYGMPDSICRHRPGAMASPMLAFFAPSRLSPRPSALRAAPTRHGPATSAA